MISVGFLQTCDEPDDGQPIFAGAASQASPTNSKRSYEDRLNVVDVVVREVAVQISDDGQLGDADFAQVHVTRGARLGRAHDDDAVASSGSAARACIACLPG